MSSQIKKITEGTLSRVTDFTLAIIFYQLELIISSPRTLSGVEKAINTVDTTLSEFNYQTIKRAVRELKQKGLINTIKDNLDEIEITRAGKNRIQAALPQYQKKRPWDQKIYLITYDIPTKQNSERDLLRNFLKRMGCGLLQKSVWVTPYNPTRIIKEFTEEKGLYGTILVSVLGKDGSIGGMSREKLIETVYKLSELNEKYKRFLAEKQENTIVFNYLSILKDDPQLPFELLPQDWLGDKAHKKFQESL